MTAQDLIDEPYEDEDDILDGDVEKIYEQAEQNENNPDSKGTEPAA